VLRPTDLAIPDQTVRLINKWLDESRVVLERQGAAEFLKLGERIQGDTAFLAASKKVWGIDETLRTRAEAASVPSGRYVRTFVITS
jgi:hypothetical protein